MLIKYKGKDEEIVRFVGDLSALLKDGRFRNEDTLLRYNVTFKQVTSILESAYGVKKFEYIVDFLKKIKDPSKKDSYCEKARQEKVLSALINVCSYPGSTETLHMFCEKWVFFLESGYSPDQIIKIGSHSGGSASLQAVIDYGADLIKEHLYTNNDIVSVACHTGGSKNLEALKKYSEQLISKFRLTQKQIISTVSHEGGSINLDTLVECWERLLALGFKKEQIIAIAKHDGGSKNIETILKHVEYLRQIGCTIEQMTKVSSHKGGSSNLETLIKYARKIPLAVEDRIVVEEEIAQAAKTSALPGMQMQAPIDIR